jgi:hypothetical protein
VDDSGVRGWPGRIYLAWSQRVAPDGDARIMMVNLPGSLLLTPAGLSLKPFPVDSMPLIDDAGTHFARGHQFMPQMAFTGGKLMVVYYDMRLDHTVATFKWAAPAPPKPGRFLETRSFVPTPDGDALANIFTTVVDDANPPLSKRRHTVDVVLAEANPSFAPVFKIARISQYKAGTRPGSSLIQQLQINPPGLPLFKQGNAPFFGDYLDVAGQMFAPKDGAWVFNTAPLKAPVHVATWTSNQDVRGPLDGDWTKYTPAWPASTTLLVFPNAAYATGVMQVPTVPVPKGATELRLAVDVSQMTNPATSYELKFDISFNDGASWGSLLDESRLGGVQQDPNGLPITTSRRAVPLAQPDNSKRLIRGTFTVLGPVVVGGNVKVVGSDRTSVFDPTKTVPACTPGREGMRNQNIYSSRLTEGLLLSSPQNSKPLSTTLQRAFVVVLHNFTSLEKSFRLSIANQPAGAGWASFVQAKNTIPLPPLPAPTTSIDVTVAARSGIARAVFALSATPTASIMVIADEISAPQAALNGGLSSFLVLNPDGTTPALINPEGAPAGSEIATAELYNPDVANPDVANPNALKSAIPNPDVANPDVANPDVANPDVANPDVANPDVANVNPMNPDVANPDVANAVVSDATYIVSNLGNTAASYKVKLVGTAPPSSARLQLILNKRYVTPVSSNCVLAEEAQNTLQANILKPAIKDPSEPANPDVANPDVANATLSLQPGETALITLRGNVDTNTMEEIISQVTPVVVAHAANTGDATPQFAAPPLAIRTTSLPDAVIGRPYTAILRASGGRPPYSWRLAGESFLPGNLELGSDGVISGPVNDARRTYSFAVAVIDGAGVERTRDLSITLEDPLALLTPWDEGPFATTLPEGVLGRKYSVQPAASGGTPPYFWSQSGLPAALHLDPRTGIISGAPRSVVRTVVKLRVTDSSHPAQQFEAEFGFTVTLVCYRDLPAPSLTYLLSKPSGALTEYDLSVTNYSFFPDELFVATPDYPPCGLNSTPSRSWVDIFQDGNHVYGFCALGTAEDLTRLWFATSGPPPSTAHITIHDRACDITYTSNPVRIGPSP